MDQRPIGFFDSGLGGISVLKSALKLLPQENYVYYGDNANAPYGDKAITEITQLTLNAAQFLISKNVKTIVLACNTATGSCISRIRSELSIPVVSVEPAIKPACESADKGKVLMLATRATVRLPRYQALVRRMPDPDRVISVACPGLVDRIEQGIFSDDAFEDLLDQYLARFRGMNISGVVLGCTHYPFIRGAICRYAHRNFSGACTIYDGSEGTARQLKRVLTAKDLLNPSGSSNVDFFTSGNKAQYTPLFQTFVAL